MVRSVCDVESFVTVLCSFDMRSHFFVHVCQKEAIPSKYWLSTSWDRGEVVLIERGPCFFLFKFCVCLCAHSIFFGTSFVHGGSGFGRRVVG